MGESVILANFKLRSGYFWVKPLSDISLQGIGARISFLEQPLKNQPGQPHKNRRDSASYTMLNNTTAIKGPQMTTTWVLVANHGNAHLFETEGAGKGLRYVQNIPHPAGRLKNQDINADKPGRSQDSMKTGGRHAMGKEYSPKEQEALRYAKHLAEILDAGRTSHRYAQVVLVAEPRLLGELRSALDPHTAALVSASHSKDLANLAEHDMATHLEKLVQC